uniref:Uncharacterized protein n=1 Tax=viral metagenome TaxID=1070528 RepID=A0A6M3XYN5_9ZZZZ
MKLKTLEEVMSDSDVPLFFKKATGRKYTNKESCINDIRRMLMLFHNEYSYSNRSKMILNKKEK